MDITNLPMITYVFDWGNYRGTHIFGIPGVLICLIACAVCWYQISNDPDNSTY